MGIGYAVSNISSLLFWVQREMFRRKMCRTTMLDMTIFGFFPCRLFRTIRKSVCVLCGAHSSVWFFTQHFCVCRVCTMWCALELLRPTNNNKSNERWERTKNVIRQCLLSSMAGFDVGHSISESLHAAAFVHLFRLFDSQFPTTATQQGDGNAHCTPTGPYINGSDRIAFATTAFLAVTTTTTTTEVIGTRAVHIGSSVRCCEWRN